MAPPSFEYAATLWGIWMAGGIAVPLAVSYPPPEIDYILEDTGAKTVIAHPQFREQLNPLAKNRGIELISTDPADVLHEGELPTIDADRRAVILYTSGTTSKPKGVVLTHRNVTAQITTLVEAWEWTSDDSTLNVLPLHHTHGLINVLSCALWAGATCEMMPEFDADRVWDRLERQDISLLMAVPTIYVKLVQTFNAHPIERQERLSAALRRMRLLVSGSSALPVGVFEAFKRISGHELLERYGMTEAGMALSNPLHGDRRPGFVGTPLPGVEVRLISNSRLVVSDEGIAAELQIKGPGVFSEYFGKPQATQAAFHDGWLRTGDIAMIEDGYYRILGRKSTDIIKTGGYKVSALEIEAALREHPAIAECAVVGVPDKEWGERVAAAIVSHQEMNLSTDALRRWAKERMAPYKVPSLIITIDELPLNAMGKVIKSHVQNLFKARPK